MVAAETHLVYRPLAVGVPFGKSRIMSIDLARVARDHGFTVRYERLLTVDLTNRIVTTSTGARPYDDLVLALGAHPAPAVAGALTFRGPQDVTTLSDALTQLESAGGGRVVFAARNVGGWMLPLYELALLTSHWARDQSLELAITIVTPERAPLEVLGATTGADLLTRHNIEHLAAMPEGAVPGGLWVPGHGRIAADIIVGLPVLTGRDIPGVPRGRLRFVEVDEFCRVAGTVAAYAVGDMTARLMKQGGLAAQQADVAAACIASGIGVGPMPTPYVPDLSATLFAGDAPPPWGPDKMFGRHLTAYLATQDEIVQPVA
jgi:sulfide:quinone oxidoreductase